MTFIAKSRGWVGGGASGDYAVQDVPVHFGTATPIMIPKPLGNFEILSFISEELCMPQTAGWMERGILL